MACKPKYIDANEVLKHRRKMKGFGISAEDEFWDYAVLEEDIKNMPAADVVEIKHGHKGLHVGHKYYCSVCGRLAYCEEFCSRCGAMLDLKGGIDNANDT